MQPINSIKKDTHIMATVQAIVTQADKITPENFVVKLEKVRRSGQRFLRGTFINVPARLVKHRDKFRRVGKNLFVVTQVLTTKVDVMPLSELVSKFGPTITLDKLKKSQTKGTWTKATPEQVEQYDFAEAALKTWAFNMTHEQAKRRVKYAETRLWRAVNEHDRCKDRLDKARDRLRQFEPT